jgi:membrane protease YdiL (CAAX protease family)
MTDHVWVWVAPPGWPPPPVGWSPPPLWQPPPDWPLPPANWQYWVPVAVPGVTTPTPVTISVDEPSRRSLVWETRFVLLAFLVPGVTAAIVLLVRHIQGIGDVKSFTNTVPGHPLSNLILGILSYLAVAAMVPLVLLLLLRTGQRPSSIGLGRPRWKADIWPAIGLVGASYLAEYVLLIPFALFIKDHSKLANTMSIGHVPAYYVIYALALSATTAVAEEVIVNGYFITRLEQFGWTPQRALALSLTLRTSYHVYYGVGFLLTIPFGYFVTRSFQKHHRLTRSITAHFIYDAILTTIAVLTS